jgi:hypothetical protein
MKRLPESLMKKKLAVKRLTASDLTFFEWHFRNQNAGNQKAINLNADVFVDQLYPSLPELAARKDGKIPLDLFLHGPGAAGELNLQRKIVKFGSYKNWRLNGEFIYEEPERFKVLHAGDFAVMEFTGEGIPHSARIVLLAANVPSDKPLCDALAVRVRSMTSLTETSLREIVSLASVPDSHPITELLLEETLEDAAQNGEQGIRRILSRRSGRRVSKEDLLRARERADEVGTGGEELVNSHLLGLQSSSGIKSFVWESQVNSVSPFDFKIERTDGTTILIDVKTTIGDFERVFHVSISELRQMADATNIYCIYRVYRMENGTAQLRISEPVQAVASNILTAFAGAPTGVTIDSISISPALLNFGAAETIQLVEIKDELALEFH